MNLADYQTTYLENFVDQLYNSIGILQPDQLTVEEVSTAVGIHIEYGPVSYAVDRGDHLTIFLNHSLTPQEQWTDFLHELCHALRHSGNQLSLPPAMRDWQEWDASNFSLYASMPLLMLRRLSLPYDQQAAVETISTVFHMPLDLAFERYQQIYRRKFQAFCQGL